MKSLTVFLRADDILFRQDRFHLYSNLLPIIPSTGLHIIPSLIPEAVLGTKEPSEKARSAAFELIVAMAKKMNEGGVVNRNMVDGMDDSEEGSSAQGGLKILYELGICP